MDPIRIEYRIRISDERTERFRFKLDGETFDLINKKVPNPPEWTRLEHNQCKHCPLDVAQHAHCPLALQLYAVVERFHDTKSIDEVKLQVITEERVVSQKVAIQYALASILGLVSPVSGCPKTAFMKPAARFHVPLASQEETVFRITGMYLLAQYFLSCDKQDAEISFDGLVQIYKDLHIVNKAIAGRLTHCTKSDSVKNAITLLDMFSMLIPALLEDELVEMRPFFEAFLKGRGGPVATSNNLEQARSFTLDLLEGAGLQEKDEGDRPAWLKRVATVDEESGERRDFQKDQQVAAEQILSHVGSDLELEPYSRELDDEDAPEKKPPGQAVFSVPDE